MKTLKQIFTTLFLTLGIGLCAQPLLKTGVPFIQYDINTERCTKLRYHTGSEITIPSNAFEGADNQRITIKYRELHDRADIIMAKIPMNLEGGGQLETGGMFEIYAETNGSPVKLKKGKKIRVRLAGLAKVNDLSSFIFDKASNQWKRLKNKITEIPVNDNLEDDELWGGSGPTPLEDFEDEGFWWGEDDWAEGDNWSGVNEQWKKSQELKFEAFRAMEIDEMGMYNYDKIIEEESAIPLIAKFEFEGKPVESVVYVTYKGLNSVITYYPYTFESDFMLLSDQDYKLFIMLTDGSIASFDETDKANFDLHKNKGKAYTFKLTREVVIPKNKEELNQAVVVK